MSYRAYPPSSELLIGYDPHRDLARDHLARLVERVVEEADLPRTVRFGKGQPAYDPRLLAKVLVYGYSTGVRSSRQLERLCSESLVYLFLTRGDAPSYRTLCNFRTRCEDLINRVYLQLFAFAAEAGMKRLGRLVVDSSKFKANAAKETVLSESQFEAAIAEFKQILKDAEEADKREDLDPPGQTGTGVDLDTEQMRDILRRVKKLARSQAEELKAAKADQDSGNPPSSPPPSSKASSGSSPSNGSDENTEAVTKPDAAGKAASKRIGARMRRVLKRAIDVLEQAKENGDRQVSLTDPDSRFMQEGRDKRLHLCYSFEAAVDKESGLLVVGQSSQSSVDNARLTPIIEAARKNEPLGVASVDADSGYFAGDQIAELALSGIDICVPDTNTAGDMRKRYEIGTIAGDNGRFTYDSDADQYTCSEGNILKRDGRTKLGAQMLTVYIAIRSCAECPLKAKCFKSAKGKYRHITRGDHAELLKGLRDRFKDRDHRRRYNHRGHHIETVFAFLRTVLGYRCWLVRTKERVAAEATLFKTAYQLRKIHAQLAN